MLLYLLADFPSQHEYSGAHMNQISEHQVSIMKTMKEIKREWLVWLICEELLPRYPDATGDQLGGWRVLARETAAFYERGENVPYKHWKKANSASYAAAAVNDASTNVDAVQAAANAAYGDAERAAYYSAADSCVRRMAEALVRITDLAPMPELDATILTALEDGGTLDMEFYHSRGCRTTHCRAGFATTLHPRGPELEVAFGSRLAGAAIYLASTGMIPDFYASDDAAMASIRKGAGL